MELKKSKGVSKTLQYIALAATALSVTACGGSSSDNTPTNTAPIAGVNTLTVQSGEATTVGLNVTDAEEDALTYAISDAPSRGTATIDEVGTITYSADNYIGTDSLVITVSDGSLETEATVDITLQADAAFDYQFYQVTNPDDLSAQIVRYDPNNPDEDTNQIVIKQGVILSDKVFVMSGAKSEDSTVYLQREYGVFLDQSALNETRQTQDQPPIEYTFYTDSVIKRFDARNTSSENTIFQSSMLSTEMTSQGVSVISSDFDLHTTEADIDNSYVQLKAFDALPDALRSETDGDKTQLPILVRISDSQAVTGNIISTLIDDSGKVTGVLLNELPAYTSDTFSSTTKSLKLCDATLTRCESITDTDGAYHFLAKNDSTVYIAKEGETTLYAYTVADGSLSEVSGVSYPAAYDAIHHQIEFNGGHGGSGIFSNFYNMPGVISSLAEGDTSYLLINYNLDTQDSIGAGAFSRFGTHPYTQKNALILKLTGNTGTKVYDNGTGVDLMNESDDIAPSFNLSLAALKDDYLFIEAAKYNGSEATNFSYQTGWLNTNTTDTKTALDNLIIDKDIPYFTGIRVPPIAVGEHVYVNEDTYTEEDTFSSTYRIYNIYKLPLADPSLSKEDDLVEHVTGRMYFERSAYRASGIYEGNVLLWDRHNNGTITNATTGEIMGVASELVEDVTNVIADGNGNGTLSGIGGLFGLHMTSSHASTPYLTSGSSDTANSLTVVNQIEGEWIID